MDAFRLQQLYTSDSGGSRKKYLGAWPLIIWGQQRLSEITTETSKNLGGLGKIWGPMPPGLSLKPPLHFRAVSDLLLRNPAGAGFCQICKANPAGAGFHHIISYQ